MYNGNVQQNPLCVKSCVTKELSISPRFSPTFFLSRCKFSALTSTPDCTAVDSKPCVRNCSREREGLYNGNVQQNPLCAASCVTKDIPVSPRFSPTVFYPDASSGLLRAHLCSAVDSKPRVRNCSRERESLYNGDVRHPQYCLYGKVPRLAVKKTNSLTQAVFYFRTHFLCGALL